MSEEAKQQQQAEEKYDHQQITVTFELYDPVLIKVQRHTHNITVGAMMGLREDCQDRFIDALRSLDMDDEKEEEDAPYLTVEFTYEHVEASEDCLQLELCIKSGECVAVDDYKEVISQLVCRVESNFREALRRQGIALQ